ncbi:hypothetical protein HUK80_12415 [Flavobacterium sp. MAH-1]|uniref:Uncharacterized protein n=1 Tax=Flavobacterium agri TaxID=2743471 RepID=A0A7Y8Y4H4_9FLAO|nr:hypothetical protein [Flavobacterium agri]NUY81704.1 hypothetical protein [Flavobacterium agri]NYA71728.1 hypothetical protein [Flavobacterium agri]
MKNKLLLGFAALALTFASCTKDEDEAFNAQSARINNEMDRIADDV